MYIKEIKLKHFRCFTDRHFNFDGQFVFVQGNNGIGKTTLLEALHYGSYLKSFRTTHQNELIQFGKEYFFMSIELTSHEDEHTTISIGFNPDEGKQVKLNAQQIKTHKELMEYIRVVTLTADDILLVSGYPEKRRAFINHTLTLHDHSHLQATKKYNAILAQRNGKLTALKKYHKPVDDELLVWTESLWNESTAFHKKALPVLQELETLVNDLLKTYFNDEQDLTIALTYQPRHIKINQSFEAFKDFFHTSLAPTEIATGRSGFGTHLDDFSISFQKKRARVYASRGQQKLIVFLLKIAQMQLIKKNGGHAILLLDDFLTDFDSSRVEACFALLEAMPFQVIITSPGITELQNIPLAQDKKTRIISL